MISVSLTLVPLITGVIHVMSDPTLVTTQEIFESAKSEPATSSLKKQNKLTGHDYQEYILSLDGWIQTLTLIDSVSRLLQRGKVFKLAGN